jgi:hypothetical protein
MEAIKNYFSKRKSNLGDTTVLMAIYLMYLHDDLKPEIKKLAIMYKLDEYITDPPQAAVDYSRSLPNTLYTNHMYDTEEYFISQHVGVSNLEQYEYKDLHDYLFTYIHDHFPNYAVILFNIASSNSLD